jgi:hypothetical protein
MYCSGAAAGVALEAPFEAAAGEAGGIAFGASAAPAVPSQTNKAPHAANWGWNERMNNGWMEIRQMQSFNCPLALPRRCGKGPCARGRRST